MTNEIKKYELRNEEIEMIISSLYKARFEDKNFDEKNSHEWYMTNIKPLSEEKDNNNFQTKRLNNLNVKVGDGITIDLYSDSHAYTVIKRTAKTITLQRDKATLDPNFKPEIIVGGFAGHCTNQNEQSYSYKADPNGSIIKLSWSEKMGGWKTPYNKIARLGRHEFYDYNF